MSYDVTSGKNSRVDPQLNTIFSLVNLGCSGIIEKFKILLFSSMRKTDIYIYDFQNASKVNIFFGITFFLSNSELQKSYNVLVKPIIIIPS